MTARQWLTKAKKEGFAIGAFNAANIETLKAIVAAAAKLKSPVIVESSHGETKFLGANNLVDLVKNYEEETGIPIFVNLDHAPTVEAAREGIAAGYEMIHINASTLPLSENIKATRTVVREAHKKHLLVEAEMTSIVGSSAAHLSETTAEALSKAQYTDPKMAVDFVERTGVDILAVSVGNVHGIYKTEPKLNIELLGELRKELSCFFSLHGGSGIPGEQVKKAIKVGGIVKVNVNSEMRIAYRETLEKVLKKNEEVAIYKVMPEVVEAVQEVVEKKIELFGSGGKV